jgi:adenylate cyclase
MESHGLHGEIRVPDRVAAALGPGFAVRLRTSDLKGKGPTTTFPPRRRRLADIRQHRTSWT